MMVTGISESVGGQLSQANLPAVALLASSGVIAMFFILRWMIRYQREFTDYYVDENNKLRARIDALETEIEAKDAKITAAAREVLRLERESQSRIGELERRIHVQETTIEDLQRRLGRS